MADRTESTPPRFFTPRYLFTFEGRANRAEYLTVGAVLMACKYLLQTLGAMAITGRSLTLSAFLVPTYTERQARFAGYTTQYLLFEILMSLPFLWIGIAMSTRRARDAAVPLSLALCFAFPVLNYLLIALLSLLPTRTRPDEEAVQGTHLSQSVVIMRCCILGVTIGVAGMLIFVYWNNSYATALFIGIPMIIGACSGMLTLRTAKPRFATALRTALVANLMAGGVVLLFAMEGLICLVMALPLALFGTLLGAAVGYQIPRRGAPLHVASILLVVAAAHVVESKSVAPPLRKVTTTVEIEATPAEVWTHVIEFSELPAPTEWLFRLGIAYPIRARLEGVGVGAVRYCEFSTGPFVEPITVWEEGERLAFTVEAQPPTMEELSIYSKIAPPHLSTVFKSQQGEFLLEEVRPGVTVLSGSTWYQLSIAPRSYWALWSDWLVHVIHSRVLRHIASEVTGAKAESYN